MAQSAPSPALDTRVICHECNLLVDLGNLQEGERADCPRCGCMLSCLHKDANTRILAFSLSALVFLVMGTGFDFIALSTVGLERDLSLPQTVATLFSLHEWSLAVFLGVVIIALPFVFLLTLGILVISLELGRAGPWSFELLRFVTFLRFWNMAEIFFLGILVAMVKIAGMAQVGLGLSFWSYALFNLFLILALSQVDRYQLGLSIRRLVESNAEAAA